MWSKGRTDQDMRPNRPALVLLTLAGSQTERPAVGEGTDMKNGSTAGRILLVAAVLAVAVVVFIAGSGKVLARLGLYQFAYA